jgi:hypothetical protein
MVDPVAHRDDVVRRLLARGISSETLRLLLPMQAPTIERLAREPRESCVLHGLPARTPDVPSSADADDRARAPGGEPTS